MMAAVHHQPAAVHAGLPSVPFQRLAAAMHGQRAACKQSKAYEYDLRYKLSQIPKLGQARAIG